LTETSWVSRRGAITATPIQTSAPEDSPPETLVAAPGSSSSHESYAARLARHARAARLHAAVGASVALLSVLVVLVSENTRTAKLDWVFGSTRASLAWIILAAAIFGWLLGITTAIVVHRRTRRGAPRSLTGVAERAVGPAEAR
jgi:uncharacterized integral membrane protein